MSRQEILIVLILIALATIRFFFFIPSTPDFEQALGQRVTFTGIVNDDPDIRLKNKQLTIKIENQDIKILVIINRALDVSYGDRVRINGILEQPENFTTQTGKEFNYKRYLANQDIYYLIKNPELEILARGQGSQIKIWLFKLKNLFIRNINQVIPPPESDLANGLVLGVRGGFDEETRNQFIETGTIHIIALSGYNVSIVAEGVMKALSLILSQTLSIVFGLVIILLFILMTGVTATAIRAGLMASIMLLGRLSGRPYLAGRALIIAALLMIAFDPRVIVDMSFQLSFLATAGVLFITPRVINYFYFLPLRFGLREMVASTMAASIAVLPIILYLTGILSLVSVPANILILLFIPIVMLLIFLTGAVYFLSPVLALPLGYLAYLILHYILGVINYLGNLTFTSLNILNFPLSITIFIYFLLGCWLFKRHRH